MDSNNKDVGPLILAITGAVTTATGLLTSLSNLFKSAQEFWQQTTTLSTWQVAIGGVLILVFGIVMVGYSRKRRSRLVRPDALRLMRSDPTHLVGRSDDIERLVQLVRGQPLVFLEGESGAGKSALLQAGLLPALAGDPALLPIYLESLVGADWQREPHRFLSAALWASLGVLERERLGLDAVPGPQEATNSLQAVLRTFGRTPLLIIDQFDDYQIRHREQFLLRRTWLRPAKLAEQNSFWRVLRDLVENGSLHLLIATRSDSAAGLSSVRFVESETYRLGRLDSHFVNQLLSTLTAGSESSPVITDPKYGWIQLRDRLARDLERASGDRDDQTILPQQLKIVLASLGTLPNRILTIAAYERAGGVAGLEARFIESRLAKVARPNGTTEKDVRSALLMLIDPTSARKTIERVTDDLAPLINPTSPQTAERVLSALEQEEVVRRRTDPATHESSWLLDHDYLTRAVREADRRANRWQRALAEGQDAFAAAGSNLALRWRALQPPLTQIAFLHDRVLGRFRYGGHTRYALKSLIRFTSPIAIIILVTAIGIKEFDRWQEDKIRNIVDDILGKLELRTEISSFDAQALMYLAKADPPVRRRILQIVLTNNDRARLFLRKPDPVMRAIAGASPQLRQQAILILATAASSASQPETMAAIAKASLLLGQPQALPFAWWMEAIGKTNDPDILQVQAEGLKASVGRLSDSQAGNAVAHFTEAIAKTTDPRTLQVLGGGLGALPVKLSDEQSRKVVAPLLDIIAKTRDSEVLLVVGEGLKATIGNLNGGNPYKTTALFLEAMARTTAPEALWILGDALGAFPGKLSDEQARRAVTSFLDAIGKTTNPASQQILSQGLKAATSNWDDRQARETLALFLDAIKKTTDPSALQTLGEGLGALPVKLSNEQVRKAVAPFLDAIGKATTPRALHALGKGLAVLPVKLTNDQTLEAVTPFLDAIGNAANPNDLLLLGEGLGALPVQLNDEQSRRAVVPFLDAMGKTTAPSALWMLGKGLNAIIGKLGAGEAPETVALILDTIKESMDPNTIRMLSEAFKVIPFKLSDAQAQEAITLFLNNIEKTENLVMLRALGEGLKAVAVKLDDRQAREAASLFLDNIGRVINPGALRVLGQGLGALPVTLKDEQVQQAVASFLEAFGKTRNADDLTLLGEGLGALPAKLSNEQARKSVMPFLRAIKGNTNPITLRKLDEGLKAAISKQDPSEIQEIASFLIGSIGENTNPASLRILGERVGILPVRLSNEQSRRAVAPFLDAIKKTTDPDALRLLGEGLGAIAPILDEKTARASRKITEEVFWPSDNIVVIATFTKLYFLLNTYENSDQEISDIFHLLRHPLSTPVTANILSERLEKISGVKVHFQGDLWKAVDWVVAERKAGRLKDIDLDAPFSLSRLP